MIKGFNIPTIDDADIRDKRVLIRVDYNVKLTPDKHEIADDLRIRQSLGTLNYLLKNNNKLIIVTHLGQPKLRDPQFSLTPVAHYLKRLLKNVQVSLVDDFRSENGKLFLSQQKAGEIILLENIRFYPEEKKNDQQFAKELANLADVYVNDAFGVDHRTDASVVSVPQFIPSYAGLLLKREIEIITEIVSNSKPPFVAIVGGAKISTKINFLKSLINRVNVLILGGGIANTFLFSEGHDVGQSLFEREEAAKAKDITTYAREKNVEIVLPKDAVTMENSVRKINEIHANESIVDIGPETQALFGSFIHNAKTLLWNGPVGLVEDPRFAIGTEFLYYAIAQNNTANSLVGGGDTIAAISKKNYIDKITWVSTGGGAMIEFVEKGTLPGLEALRKNS